MTYPCVGCGKHDGRTALGSIWCHDCLFLPDEERRKLWLLFVNLEKREEELQAA